MQIMPCGCTDHLADVPVSSYDYRQVFELQEPKLKVFEYKSEIKICPQCGQPVKAPFPEGVNAPVGMEHDFGNACIHAKPAFSPR